MKGFVVQESNRATNKRCTGPNQGPYKPTTHFCTFKKD